MKVKLISVALLVGLLCCCTAYAEETLSGIGIVLTAKDHTISIMKVMPDTPASRAGLSSGLIVKKIDGKSTDGMLLKPCIDMLRGAAGTKVKLELIDSLGSKPIRLELTRETLRI